MKKFFSFISAIILMCSMFTGCVSAMQPGIVIKLEIDNPIMTVNGVEKEIDSENSTAPLIVDGRTLVPIRAVIESLGGSVLWDDVTKTTTLEMNKNIVTLTIDSTVAYKNESEHTLDVPPRIINGRTMLPIRFVAESFGLNVDWNHFTRTVTISKISVLLYDVPPYSGKPYIMVNENVPMFTSSQITDKSFEKYGNLDSLGRCGTCIASIGTDIMPTEERGEIGSVKPTGWHSVKYDNVDGKYLYNRCHLIGYQLTAENANVKNLITGTRYMNVEGMLPFENMVADYIKETGNHVMYRVTPVYSGKNLLANGVLMEAYSVEDNGRGVEFCVYCYNVQPGIQIDYATGESLYVGETPQVSSDEKSYVLNVNTKRFHYEDCSSVSDMQNKNKAVSEKTREELIADGYSPCGICNP